jgi:hypothetical protein
LAGIAERAEAFLVLFDLRGAFTRRVQQLALLPNVLFFRDAENVDLASRGFHGDA